MEILHLLLYLETVSEGGNVLVSALTFAGLIVTFAFQRYELEMQRQELKAQRVEISSQNKSLRLQRFENTFFNMMEFQQHIVNDLYACRKGSKETIIEKNSSWNWKTEERCKDAI